MSEQTYYGIADAHGIESFIPYEKRVNDKFPYIMRAEFNRHRHAVYYLVTIDKIDARMVEALLEMSKYKKALKLLKKRAITIGYPDVHAEEYKKSWDLIPNSKLDKYH